MNTMAVGSANLFATDSAGFQSSVQVLIKRELVEALRHTLDWCPPGVCVPAVYVPGVGTPASGYTFRSFSIADIAPGVPTPLIEGTPPAPSTLAETFFDVIAWQYGKTVKATDLSVLESPFNIPATMTERVIRWGAETMDAIASGVWNTGTAGEVVVNPDDGSGGAAAVGNKPRLETFALAAAILGNRGVPRVGANYIALISEATAYELSVSKGELALQQNREFARPGDLVTGSIGIWHGIDFRTVGHPLVNAGVVTDVVCGAEALAYSELSQIASGYVPPLPSAADPLGQNALAGVKFLFGAGLVTIGGATAATSLRYVKVKSTPSVLPA
jgi:N4-gp56 family major capsid protein